MFYKSDYDMNKTLCINSQNIGSNTTEVLSAAEVEIFGLEYEKKIKRYTCK